MATRTGSTTRSSSRSTADRRGSQSSTRDDYDDAMNDGSPEEFRTGHRSGVHRDIAEGIRVSAEMPNSKVARITIDIDWQHVVSRVARTVRRKIKNRSGRSERRTGESSRPSRARRSSS